MIGPTFNPDDRFCMHLIATTQREKGTSKFECDCEEEQCRIDCPNNEKICPMQTNMLKKLIGLPNKIDINNSLIGPNCEIIKEICTHLCTVTRPAKGTSDFICICGDDCYKDGICPITTEMRKQLDEISKKMKGELVSPPL